MPQTIQYTFREYMYLPGKKHVWVAKLRNIGDYTSAAELKRYYCINR